MKDVHGDLSSLYKAPVIHDGKGTSFRGCTVGWDKLPQVPMGESGSHKLMPSSPNSNCHQLGFVGTLRLLRWFDRSPDSLVQRESSPSDETRA